MWGRREIRRRADRRAFQPGIDGRLESRVLLSRIAKPNNYPKGIPGEIYTALGGQAVEVTNPAGQSFYIAVSTGTIRAYRMSGGRFGLVVQGSSVDTDLTISPLGDLRVKGNAHTFTDRLSHYNQMVNIGAISVKNGVLNSILGYRDAVLSGPIVVSGMNRVDRIAFDTIMPGASIVTGGDVNSLDVLNSITLSGPGTGISIGRDLNELSVGGNVLISNGAVFSIARYQGLVPQPPKGTAPAPQPIITITLGSTNITNNPTATAAINGNLIVSTGGKFLVNGALQGYFLVDGATAGASTGGFFINNPGGLPPQANSFFISRGGVS